MLKTAIAAGLLLPISALAQKSRFADPPMPEFRVEAEGFGASAADIRAILQSTGRELWRFFPKYEIEPFVVSRGNRNPIVLHGRNARGEIVMRLSTEKTFWSQYAYQFAHEFCHILCGFDNDDSPHEWFEETLCETASLFAMRAMAETWKDQAPYPNWVDYRHSLKQYADDVIASRAEIENGALAAFFREHEAELTESTNNRELNGAIAVVLLDWFEANPKHWEAVRWLNPSPAAAGETFGAYLGKWRAAAPKRHRGFIERIARAFEVELVAPES